MNTRFNRTPEAITAARIADLERQAELAHATAYTLDRLGRHDDATAFILDAGQLRDEADELRGA